MKLTDRYTEEDIQAINCLSGITAMLMFIMALIAQAVGIL
jgi:hypothetical protein